MEEDRPHDARILDGYRLIRFLGRGGFGEVWLCRSEAMGGYHALKFIAGISPDLLAKEHEALALYRKEAARLRSPHLMPIEHINRNESGLYYVMPLADGVTTGDPVDPTWQPLSLAAKIHAQETKPQWFSSAEIAAILRPLLEALQTLSDAGLVHRDVKPDNILYFNGQPCLGDISLLGSDASVITRRGTPGYMTPSWYVGGHPDMYGAAALLYTLLTGNLPDKMGRSAFLWPPQNEASLTAAERVEWKRLHAIIRRASDEKVSERFVDFAAMADAITAAAIPARSALSGTAIKVALALLACIVIGWGLRYFFTGAGLAPAISPSVSHSDGSASEAYDNANLAYNTLSWIPSQTEKMSFEENNLYQDTLPKIQNCLSNKDSLDFPGAVRLLDACRQAIPSLKTDPNAELARLLLLQCAGDRAQVKSKIDDPSFIAPGDDDLGWRVGLLCRLNAQDKAEKLLENFISAVEPPAREKSRAFLQRARMRAEQGKFADAQTDARKSIELVADEPLEKTKRQMDLMEIQKSLPGYAAFLKTHPEK